MRFFLKEHSYYLTIICLHCSVFLDSERIKDNVNRVKNYHFYKKSSTPLCIHLFFVVIYQYILSIVILYVIKSIFFVCTFISTQCIKRNLSIIAAKSIFQLSRTDVHKGLFYLHITNTYQGSKNIQFITGFKL